MNEEQDIKQEDVQIPKGWREIAHEEWKREFIERNGGQISVRVTGTALLILDQPGCRSFIIEMDSAAHAFRAANAMIEGRVRWLDPNDPAHMTEDQLRDEVIRLRAQMPPGFWAVHD